MQIEKNKVVTFHYILTEVDGDQIEDSRSGDPVASLHGSGSILPALEKALEGKQAGDKLSITLPPEQAYGERKADSIARVPVKHLLSKGKLKVGKVVELNTDNGPQPATVVKVGRYSVDVDRNNPLAGKTLTFDLDITDVRDSTQAERAHGHSHGVGGHQH